MLAVAVVGSSTVGVLKGGAIGSRDDVTLGSMLRVREGVVDGPDNNTNTFDTATNACSLL